MNNQQWNNTDAKIAELEIVKKILSAILKLKIKYMHLTIEQLDEKLKSLFPDFVENYKTLYKLILNDDNVDMAFNMIQQMIDVCNNKKNINDVTKNISDKLANDYLYNKLGKPDDFNKNK